MLRLYHDKEDSIIHGSKTEERENGENGEPWLAYVKRG
jgi:hypothetical protein